MTVPALLLLGTLAQAAVPTPGAAGASIAPLVDRVKDTVVTIQSVKILKRVTRLDPISQYLRERFGIGEAPQPQRQQQSLGSGFVYDARRGLVLTNNHVVAGADEVKVLLSDLRSLDAVVVGSDDHTDVAVVRILKPPADLRAVVLGNSDRVRVGDYVLAIGNPLGLGQTVTMGIVSATNRGLGGKLLKLEDFIQTDAAINQGNSGGPLFNFNGEVIGVNSAILNPAMAMNVGFAIPVNLAKQIGEQLVGNNGRVARGWLGVITMDLNPELARRLGVPFQPGVVVNSVQPGSPADRGGLRPNDLIVDVAGRRIIDNTTLQLAVRARRPNDAVTIVVVRGGRRMELKVVLTEEVRPKATEAFGISVVPLAPEEQRALGTQALKVISVDGKGPASGTVQQGDLILGLTIGSGRPVQATVQSLKELERRVEAGGFGRLVILRDGEQIVITVG